MKSRLLATKITIATTTATTKSRSPSDSFWDVSDVVTQVPKWLYTRLWIVIWLVIMLLVPSSIDLATFVASRAQLDQPFKSISSFNLLLPWAPYHPWLTTIYIGEKLSKLAGNSASCPLTSQSTEMSWISVDLWRNVWKKLYAFLPISYIDPINLHFLVFTNVWLGTIF